MNVLAFWVCVDILASVTGTKETAFVLAWQMIFAESGMVW